MDEFKYRDYLIIKRGEKFKPGELYKTISYSVKSENRNLLFIFKIPLIDFSIKTKQRANDKFFKSLATEVIKIYVNENKIDEKEKYIFQYKENSYILIN